MRHVWYNLFTKSVFIVVSYILTHQLPHILNCFADFF